MTKKRVVSTVNCRKPPAKTLAIYNYGVVQRVTSSTNIELTPFQPLL
jgi:hypothetical protein